MFKSKKDMILHKEIVHIYTFHENINLIDFALMRTYIILFIWI